MKILRHDRPWDWDEPWKHPDQGRGPRDWDENQEGIYLREWNE